MNASSSRGHTIITIEFKQMEQVMDKKVEKFSVINLVDLAGSEKVGKTGATGDRLKEGFIKLFKILGNIKYLGQISLNLKLVPVLPDTSTPHPLPPSFSSHHSSFSHSPARGLELAAR